MRVKDKGFVENFLKRDGRLNRWRYFKRMLALLLISEAVVVVVSIVTVIISIFLMPNASLTSDEELRNNAIIFTKAVCFLMTPAYFCLMVRRLHDLNKSEKIAYVLTAIICVNIFTLDVEPTEDSVLENILQWINFVFTLYLFLFPGTKGDNQYGADPLE